MLIALLFKQAKYLITLTVILNVATGLYGQTAAHIDTALQFNKPYSRCENRWVAIPLISTRGQYAYGFMYIDPEVGFTFSHEGYFKLNPNGTLAKINTAARNLRFVDPRRDARQMLAVITTDRYAQLGIPPGMPTWTKVYNSYADTAAHYSKWAKFYNQANDHEYAIKYMLKAYRLQPHNPNIAGQMAGMLQGLKNDAGEEQILVNALKTNPNDPILRAELGYLIIRQGDYQYGIVCLTDAVKLCGPADTDLKAQLALNLAIACKSNKDLPGFRLWINNAIHWAGRNTDTYNQAIQLNAQY